MKFHCNKTKLPRNARALEVEAKCFVEYPYEVAAPPLIVPPSAESADDNAVINASWRQAFAIDIEDQQLYEVAAPPLSLPPSVEGADDNAIINAPWRQTVAIDIENQQPYQVAVPPSVEGADENGFFALFAQLAVATVLMFKVLLVPLNARVCGRCCGDGGRGSVQEGDADVRLDTPLRKLNSTFREGVSHGRRLFQGLTGRIRNVFQNPSAWTTKIVGLANAFSVFDLPPSPGHERYDSEDLFATDRIRLKASKVVAFGVEFVCRETAIMYPEVGYKQGFDAACKAIFLATGSDMIATLDIFPKWAVAVTWLLCDRTTKNTTPAIKAVECAWALIKQRVPTVFGWLSRDPVVGSDDDAKMTENLFKHVFFEPLATFCAQLGLREAVLRRVIECTMEAGGHGPAVTMYVVSCLLCVVGQEGVGSLDEGGMVKTHLQVAAQSVRSFAALERVAPLSLSEFLSGYSVATIGVLGASWWYCD